MDATKPSGSGDPSSFGPLTKDHLKKLGKESEEMQKKANELKKLTDKALAKVTKTEDNLLAKFSDEEMRETKTKEDEITAAIDAIDNLDSIKKDIEEIKKIVSQFKQLKEK